MIMFFIYILGLSYIIYCFVDTFISIRKDKKLLDEIEYYKRIVKDLENELKEIKIERNVFRDFIDEFLNDSKDNDKLVEVYDE